MSQSLRDLTLQVIMATGGDPKRLDEAVAVIETALPGWRPIATAPKDGTFIHVWFPDNGDNLASLCLTCSWKLLPESGLTRGAWFSQSGGRAFRMDGASHWKPIIPPAPEAAE